MKNILLIAVVLLAAAGLLLAQEGKPAGRAGREEVEKSRDEIADEIEMYYEAGPRLTKVFERFGDYIAAETLSIAMHNRSPPEGTHVAEYILDGEKMRIGLALASKG